MELCYFKHASANVNLWRHAKHKKVVSSLPQGTQRRLKRQNTLLSLRLVFSIKLFVDVSAIKINI